MFDFDPTTHFLCNRFVGQSYPYRDAEFETRSDLDGIERPAGRTFHDLVEASLSTISSSYGWVQNRAWKVYSEAYALNATIDLQARGEHHDWEACTDGACPYAAPFEA